MFGEVQFSISCNYRCKEHGVNFFDTAEMYGYGNSDIILGKAFKKLGWKRSDFVLTTKIFLCGPGPNDKFLSRKHIIEGTLASIERLQVEYVDILYAHRYDRETPMEEICRAFNWLIQKGKAFYWGTSEWSPEQIMEANECCEKHHLIKPIVEQPEYNMLSRENIEVKLTSLFDKYGLGSTVWYPIAGGYLTGKYNEGKAPQGSRYENPTGFYANILKKYIAGDSPRFYKKLQALGALAKEIGCTQTQLAIAWVIMNKDVSVCILGATKPEQLEENFGAIDVCKKWNCDIELKIERILENMPEPPFNWRHWKNLPPRRCMVLDYDVLGGNPTAFQIHRESLRGSGAEKCWGAYSCYKETIEKGQCTCCPSQECKPEEKKK